MSASTEIVALLKAASSLKESERVKLFNAVSAALGELVRDLAPDPALSPRLIRADDIDANAYNPNFVASTELDLLENSMRADGITMAVVVVREGKRHTVVDGFHRRRTAIERLGRRYVPCAVIDSPVADRMASTVRHNRARGKHQVELMGSLVRGMLELGWDDAKISTNLGMTVEELLRLKQTVGVAAILASPEYGRAWEGRDGPDRVDPQES